MMSTMTEMATPAVSLPEAGRVTLGDVSWEVYKALRDAPANRHVRMSYQDGRLELMSPLYRHELYAGRLAKVVLAVTGVLGIPCQESRATTFRRKGKGKGRAKGKGAEADTSFYIANEPSVRGKLKIDLKRDPPPDLAIEVDETTESGSKLPIFAALCVPEVWRFDTEDESLWMGRLLDDGSYLECERSVSLPMLTPERIINWLRRSTLLSESDWFMQLLGWVRAELVPGE